MAGLYDGLEEVGFKRVDGGYVFQTNNRWLIGPTRRFLVNEAQKAEIAACIRETLQRIRPFVLATAILMPLILIGGIHWFTLTGATLNVTVTDAGGKITTYSESIGRHGASGTLAGANGSHVVFTVSGPPGNGATVTITSFDARGKANAPAVVAFNAAGTTVNTADGKGHIVNSAKLVGRKGATHTAIMVFGFIFGLSLFGLYIGLLHAYSMARLRPLIAGLPRTNERITVREGMARYAGKASNKLLAMMGFGAAMMLLGNGLNVTDAILSHRPIDNPSFIIGAVSSILVTAQFALLMVLKMRQKRSAA